jgi:hypothetical protein
MRSITSGANGGRPSLLRPRDLQVHLIKVFPLASAFGDQLETCSSKAHLFHGSTVSNLAVTGLTFADFPLAVPLAKNGYGQYLLNLFK